MRDVASRLLNVRLGPEDERLVRHLRARGMPISEVVRRALRAAASTLAPDPSGVDRLIDEMLSRFPTPAVRPRARAGPRATDRRAVRRHIQARLRAGE